MSTDCLQGEFAKIVDERKCTEAMRLLHFGKLSGPWEFEQMPLHDMNVRFASFLQHNTESNVALNAAFQVLTMTERAMVVFVSRHFPSYCLLRSNVVNLTEEESRIAEKADSAFVKSTIPYFSLPLPVPETLITSPVGRMHMWVMVTDDSKLSSR